MDDFSEQALLDTDMRHRTSHAEIIVASLKRQLYLEQQAHGQTRARANSLAAQVAARDVLLEGLAQNAATSPASHLDDPLLQGNGKGKSAVKANMLDVGRDLDLVEISALFEATAENNRALENDIHALSQKLAETRRKTLLASPRPQHADYDLTFIGPPSTKTSSSLDRPSSYPIQHDQPYSSGSRPGHHVSTPMPPTSSSPRRGRTRPASQPQYPPSAAPEQQPRSQSRQHLPITRRRSPSSPPAEQMVQHLSEQIRLLSVEIDAFHTQRVLLSRVIDSQLHKAEDATVTPEAYHSYDSFDADGDQSFFAGDEDEHGLNTPGQLPHRPQFSPDAADGDGNGDEITEDGERSMEISTPLSSLVTFLASSADGSEAYQEADEGARGGNGGLPEEVEEQDDGQIRMIRPRRALSVSPPAP
ncbi:hypothetical protein DXG01_013511 [Tephrocybe rancida]|nr:hypothetical protein DXG01_013511 [Tephrocybe rancida]